MYLIAFIAKGDIYADFVCTDYSLTDLIRGAEDSLLKYGTLAGILKDVERFKRLNLLGEDHCLYAAPYFYFKRFKGKVKSMFIREYGLKIE